MYFRETSRGAEAKDMRDLGIFQKVHKSNIAARRKKSGRVPRWRLGPHYAKELRF